MSLPELETSQRRIAALEQAYFSDPARTLRLTAGEVLMKSGEENRRLYFVKQGQLGGRLSSGAISERVTFDPGHFAGVQSFFSRSFIAAFTVEALGDSVVAFIEEDQEPVEIHGSISIAEQFLPVVVDILMHRQLLMQLMADKQENVMMKMREVEKLASLGQLSAGVAHELNNTLAVLAQGARWISDYVADDVAERGGLDATFFKSGLENGRSLASAEVRRRSGILKEALKLQTAEARYLARTDIPLDELKSLSRKDLKRAQHLHTCWEVGATLHDMLVGAAQAEHVVASMRDLGAPTSERRSGVDVAETIRRALALTHSRHKNMSVNVNLDPLPTITGNSGELVQVWTNLIKNACDAMENAGVQEPRLEIQAKCAMKTIQVCIWDNGPGIDEEILPQIFQPNVTTKKKGLSFGLGLGLTIVHRLVTDYGGTISAKSSSEGAVFKVILPAEGN